MRGDALAGYERREEEFGSEVMRELERRVVLSVLDRKWREHLYEMDYLREGIGLRAMAQRDPLIEYQREGYDMFSSMMEGIKEESVGTCCSTPGSRCRRMRPRPRRRPPCRSRLPRSRPRTVRPRHVSRPAAARPGRPGPGGAGRPRGTRAPRRAGPSPPGCPAAGRRRASSNGPPSSSTPRPTMDGGAGVEHHTESGGDGDFARVGRNDLCPCGSGRKFKRCHGDPRTRGGA